MTRFLILLMASLLFSTAAAVTVDVTWDNATKNVDGTDLTNLAKTRIEYGTCAASQFGTRQGAIEVNASQTTLQLNLVVVQVYCIRGFHITDAGVESASSNVAVKTVNATPVPGPPRNMTVSGTTVYTVIKQPNKFLMVPVGTVPQGTACVSTEAINGYNVVPREAVTWSGNIRPDVVVASCL